MDEWIVNMSGVIEMRASFCFDFIRRKLPLAGMSEAVYIDIVLPLEKSEDVVLWKKEAARALRVKEVCEVRLRKHSIDARQKRIKVRLRLEVGVNAPLLQDGMPQKIKRGGGKVGKQLVIVGCGPAGLFAALRALELGLKPVVLERGKDASSRRFDLAPIMREGRVVEESNYCFGEGGAGTFSDGKLYTRATKRGPVAKIYETFVAHGAPEQIRVDAHPHIGSNLLPKVVMEMRKTIIDHGGEVRFESKVVDLILKDQKLLGVQTSQGEEVFGEAVILATGHSARDIYRLLDRRGVTLEQKPFAVGVRIEHPQELIDSMQYHYGRGRERPRLLPAARYRLATKIEGRGIHSFCMCPGGFIVPAATENDEVVVNGMSLSRRDSEFANSGLVVTVEPEDTEEFRQSHGVLAGIAYQKDLEQRSKKAGGGGQVAPGQRLQDFLKGRLSDQLVKTSYFPGLNSAPIHEILPKKVSDLMQRGLRQFGKKAPPYLSEECGLVGFETRTSSPVRIPRDPDTLEHPEVEALFPCAEGAGYAGGIVSAALDGMRCAESVAEKIHGEMA